MPSCAINLFQIKTPQVGIEPTTDWLTVNRSTTELLKNKIGLINFVNSSIKLILLIVFQLNLTQENYE